MKRQYDYFSNESFVGQTLEESSDYMEEFDSRDSGISMGLGSSSQPLSQNKGKLHPFIPNFGPLFFIKCDANDSSLY